MKQCFGYVRVSSQKQGEGVSLEAQKDAIEYFASQNNITICKWFEETQTAAKKGRPVFTAMTKALQNGKADGVVMHKIDRSARNFFDWAKVGELADAGVEIHFATESLDFQSRGGRLTANIQMAVAEDYVRNLKAEIHKGQRGQLERGYYPFKAPVGYLNNGRHQLKTLDPIKAPLVKLAFELYASGQHSLHSLRHELVQRGLSKPSGQPISKGCLEKFLRNPFYTGIIRIQRTGETFHGIHEPLISANLFEQVTNVRARKCGKKVTRHNHLYRGLFQCANCERSMIPEKQKGYVYYRCQFLSCPGNCIREEKLEHAVLSELTKVKLSEGIQKSILETLAETDQKLMQQQSVNAHQMKIDSVTQHIEKLEDAAIDRIIDAETFHARKEKLLLERKKLEEAQAENTKNRVSPSVMASFLERLKNLSIHYKIAHPAEKREIVEIAISNRRVHDKKVYLEPSNWLRTVQQSLGVFYCAQSRTTSRTSHPNTAEAVETLKELAAGPEVQCLFGEFMDGYKRAIGLNEGNACIQARENGRFLANNQKS